MAKDVERLKKIFSSVDLQQVAISSGAGEPDVEVNLLNMVRGVDVAGNENALPIEVFSPAIRVLRHAHYEPERNLNSRLKRFHLSIHAGEDYSHLVSGLRLIDETVQFCNMQTGDRLGHALALGVDAPTWAS